MLEKLPPPFLMLLPPLKRLQVELALRHVRLVTLVQLLTFVPLMTPV